MSVLLIGENMEHREWGEHRALPSLSMFDQ
jgi:hypothetical protein